MATCVAFLALASTLAIPTAHPGVAAATVAATPGCRQAPDHSFRPTSITIPGIVGRTKVLARGRDRHGAPRTPPLTNRGKWQFAWDQKSKVRPGSRHGVVPLNAHTYPRDGSYGLALGNRLLTRLRPGDLIVAQGPNRQRLCYRVTRRIQVPAHRTLPGYYSTSGKPRLGILVCSGRRRGPGDWSHRTIWYAEPVRAS